MATENLMVASTLDSLAVGQEFFTLPAHMTLLPWFELATSRWSELSSELQDTVDETTMPVALTGDEVSYGEHQDTSVRLLNRPTTSFNLINGFDIHARLYRSVQALGGQFDETYMGVNWSPHVTMTPDRMLDEGESIAFDNITIFAKQALSRNKTVRSIVHWSRHE